MASIKLETAKTWKKIIDPTGEWLEIEMDEKNGVKTIRCLLCTKFVDKLKMKRNFSFAFVNGISGASIKKDSLVKHSKSEMHTTAVSLQHKPDTIKEVMNTPIGKAFGQASNADEKKIGKLMDIAYFVVKKELPFSVFPGIAKLEKKHGVQLGDAYLNDKKCQEFSRCIADTFSEDLKEELKAANYMSIMVDESTDISTKQKLLIYARFVGVEGNIKTKFVALRDLSDATAKGILNTVLDILFEYGVEEISEKLVGFCSDGASVNLGIHKGLVKLISEKCPWLVAIHCFNHRLELAVKDSIEKSYFERVICLLQFLYSFYKRSTKRRREVTELSEVLDEEENSKNYSPTNIQGTRWIDYKRRAANSLIASYNVVVAHLENTIENAEETLADNSKIFGYLKWMKSKKFVFHLLLLSKVCEHLSKLSLCLEKDTCNLLNARIYMERFERLVEKVKNPDDENGLENDENFKNVLTVGKFCNIKLSGPEVDASCAYEYLDCLNKSIKDRFKDLSSGIISCLKVLDVSIWPQEEKSLDSFGNEEIQTLIGHFGAFLKARQMAVHSIADEWAELKSLWFLSYKHLSRSEIWVIVLKSKREFFPNLSHLFEILLIIPASNAVVERCFSYMARIKTDFRSKMGQEVLDNLIRISVEGPEMDDFSTDRAVKNFFSKPRRPNVQPYGKRKREDN